MILRYLHMNLHHEEYNHFHDKRVHFLTTNIRKGKYNSHQSHKKHKKLTSPVKGPSSPVRENISPVREQCKSPVKELSLSPVKEDQSPVRITSKTGKKRQGESNDSEKRSDQVRRLLISMPHKQRLWFRIWKSHRVCRAWILIRFKKLTINMKWPPLCMKKWLTLFAVILLLESLKPLQRK